MDRIIMQGLVFYAYHGVLAEEKTLGQRFIVDLSLELDLRTAGQLDDLTSTVNYGEVYETIRGIISGHKFALIEALAEKIAQEILDGYQVNSLTIKIRKPQAPIPGVFEYVGVEIIRNKG
ncbi:MAG: dihydroneopterin aldolase [Carboxydocellales bacterium]